MDLKQLQLFRENYKEEILQAKFNKKITQLSIVLMMVASLDENEFNQYEEQMWGAFGENPSTDTTYIDPNHLKRVCWKLKTKKYKHFFKNTKAKNRKDKKVEKQQVKKEKKEKKRKHTKMSEEQKHESSKSFID